MFSPLASCFWLLQNVSPSSNKLSLKIISRLCFACYAGHVSLFYACWIARIMKVPCPEFGLLPQASGERRPLTFEEVVSSHNCVTSILSSQDRNVNDLPFLRLRELYKRGKRFVFLETFLSLVLWSNAAFLSSLVTGLEAMRATDVVRPYISFMQLFSLRFFPMRGVILTTYWLRLFGLY